MYLANDYDSFDYDADYDEYEYEEAYLCHYHIDDPYYHIDDSDDDGDVVTPTERILYAETGQRTVFGTTTPLDVILSAETRQRTIHILNEEDYFLVTCYVCMELRLEGFMETTYMCCACNVSAKPAQIVNAFLLMLETHVIPPPYSVASDDELGQEIVRAQKLAGGENANHSAQLLKAAYAAVVTDEPTTAYFTCDFYPCEKCGAILPNSYFGTFPNDEDCAFCYIRSFRQR
ncbi:MAG TPA: hypothetical protein VFQ26_02180 [Nitrospiraceae bacterium]|nr:hypothetical protein [Nitrospiraceae bacterium]